MTKEKKRNSKIIELSSSLFVLRLLQKRADDATKKDTTTERR